MPKLQFNGGAYKICVPKELVTQKGWKKGMTLFFCVNNETYEISVKTGQEIMRGRLENG